MAGHKVLFLVHAETAFEERQPEGYAARIARSVQRNGYARVVHFVTGGSDSSEIDGLAGVVTERVTWAGSYEVGSFDDPDELDWLLVPHPNSVHTLTWVPPVLREPGWRNASIWLAGGLRGMCLGDMEAILRHLHLPYRIVPALVYPDLNAM